MLHLLSWLLTFTVSICFVLSEDGFSCVGTYTISEETPIFIYHVADVWRYTNLGQQRICVVVTCKECPVLIEYTRSCNVSWGYEHCPDSTLVRINGEKFPRLTCESSYQDESNQTLLEICTHELNGDFNFYYDRDHDAGYDSSSGTISLQVTQWMLDGYDYFLNPMSLEPSSQVYVGIADSPRPSWVILPLSEMNPFFLDALTLMAGCEYDLIIGAPPGKANADYFGRRLITFRDRPVEGFVRQYLNAPVYSLLVPPHCPARIDLSRPSDRGYLDSSMMICAGDTFLVNPDFASNNPDNYYRQTLYQEIKCDESLINVIFEIDTFNDGHLMIMNYKDLDRQFEESRFEHTEKIDHPFNYTVLNIADTVVIWSPGMTSDGMLARVHIVKSDGHTEEWSESSSTIEQTTTHHYAIKHQSTTSGSTRFNVQFGALIILVGCLALA